MARTNAISILQSIGVNADLKELYGFVVDNLQKESLSFALKNQDYTGNPAAGSVEYRRFANTGSSAYGNARANGGAKITAPAIPVNLSTHREIVEEVAKFDLDTFGVAGVMRRRVLGQLDTLSAELDIAFFAQANTEATVATTTASDAIGKLEEAIVELETASNAYTRGVPRNMIRVVCSPLFFSQIRTALDSLPASNVDTAAEEFGIYHGVRVYSSVYLPAGIDALIFPQGSIGQPVVTYEYGEPEKIPQSNDYSVALFFDYGTKALAPELILSIEAVPTALGELDVTSKAGAGSAGDTKILVDPADAGMGNEYVYKLGTKYENFGYNADLSSGWTDLTQDTDIAAGINTHITVAEVVSATGRARGRGIAKLVKKA